MSTAQSAPPQKISTTCCIVGGGPAGMMLGYLLARSGVSVAILEKHADFLRDFRGDTVHPSTLEVMHELGLLQEFLKRPHENVAQLGGKICGKSVIIADFSHLPTQCKYVAFMPQWDFLNFLADHGRKYPSFNLHMQTEAHTLVKQNGRITGILAKTPTGELEITAKLVVGCDGRHSCIRPQAGLEVEDIGAPMDVLWMRIARQPGDPQETGGYFDAGKILVMINRNDYWQCGYIIPKGGFDQLRTQGLPAFREELAKIAPFLQGRLDDLAGWDQVRLLTVAVDRLTEWHRPGLLCIGDAAHAMSPIGGVGINLAVQDAVAAANILAGPLRAGALTNDHLVQIQERRMFPTRVTQRLQVLVQNKIVTRVLGSSEAFPLPWPLKLLGVFPILRRIPARIIGMGVRPEHVTCRELPRIA